MAQSLSAVKLHPVFSTKGRRHFRRELELRDSLRGYPGAISKQLECAPPGIGGVEDHVQILARLGRTISQGDWIKEMKRASNLPAKVAPLPPSSTSGVGPEGGRKIRPLNINGSHHGASRKGWFLTIKCKSWARKAPG